MDRYINTLYQIVAAGQKTNSYKFALWRALARLAPTTDEAKPDISKHDLAPLFLNIIGRWKPNTTFGRVSIRTKTRQ